MPDYLAPIAAAVITQKIKARDKRLLLTAAAAFINGPLALAPALIGLRHEKDEPRDIETGGQGLLNEEVEVPRATNMPFEEAKRIVENAKLKAVPEEHVSTDPKLFDKVYKQVPAAGAFRNPGTDVILSVHRAPRHRGRETTYEVVVQLRDLLAEDVAARKAQAAGAASSPTGGAPGAGAAAPADVTPVQGGTPVQGAAGEAKTEPGAAEVEKGKKP